MAKDQTDYEDGDDEVDVGELRKESLMADARDVMIQQIRAHMSMPWSLLPEDKQREIANVCEAAAKHLVRQTVTMIGSHDFPHVVVELGELKQKPGKPLELKLSVSNIKQNRDVLGDHSGQMCTLYMIDAETLFGEERPADVQPDQGRLPIGDDDAEAA